jgi:hypothetical protein
MISGMYLGEITRNILLSLVDAAPKSLLFGGKTTTALNSQWGFDTSVMSGVEEAWEGQDSNNHTGGNPVPQLSTFDAPEKLDPLVKARLERVRAVLVKELSFKEADVSLKDAAVKFFPTFGHYHLIRLFLDCPMGQLVGCAARGAPEWSGCCDGVNSDRPRCFGWSRR